MRPSFSSAHHPLNLYRVLRRDCERPVLSLLCSAHISGFCTSGFCLAQNVENLPEIPLIWLFLCVWSYDRRHGYGSAAFLSDSDEPARIPDNRLFPNTKRCHRHAKHQSSLSQNQFCNTRNPVDSFPPSHPTGYYSYGPAPAWSYPKHSLFLKQYMQILPAAEMQ